LEYLSIIDIPGVNPIAFKAFLHWLFASIGCLPQSLLLAVVRFELARLILA
jgi:hypothetical protein